MCGMPKNPFATTPSEQWTQKQANPFLRNGNRNGNSIINSNGNSNSNNNSNMFLVPGHGSGTGSGPVDAPITFDEQSFPSLTPSADCKKQAGLNFKLAVSTGLGLAPNSSRDGTSLKQGITSLQQGITSLNSNNMFLCPHWNANANTNANAYDYADADADAYADTDAYDSAYTKYYNDGR
jgi:hypothetical protein